MASGCTPWRLYPPKVLELSFQRCVVHLQHDCARLDEGEELNDALLDFFVKLGQALIPPKTEGCLPPVAYLGSHFYPTLKKSGVKDGRAGHANVANWAKRRLGKDRLFSDAIGALAVPVNEVLLDDDGEEKGKHWWLALLLNPRGASQSYNDEAVSVIFLDSLACSEVSIEPPLRAIKDGRMGEYWVEIHSAQRVGYLTTVQFLATGDGSAGPVGDPARSTLWVGQKAFECPDLDISEKSCRGGDGRPGVVRGTLEFIMDSESCSMDEYILEYAESGMYQPELHFVCDRKASASQQTCARFLAGYVATEWEKLAEASGRPADFDESKVTKGLSLPGVPQQENSSDCGFFILEQVLRTLQLHPVVLRALAKAGHRDLASLPWPSQQDVTARKAKLRDCLGHLFQAACTHGINDVEALFRADPKLEHIARLALWEDEAPDRKSVV